LKSKGGENGPYISSGLGIRQFPDLDTGNR
jgi:hypothetical protein